MAKRFCKLNRRDITEHLGEIHRLVSEPKFVWVRVLARLPIKRIYVSLPRFHRRVAKASQIAKR